MPESPTPDPATPDGEPMPDATFSAADADLMFHTAAGAVPADTPADAPEDRSPALDADQFLEPLDMDRSPTVYPDAILWPHDPAASPTWAAGGIDDSSSAWGRPTLPPATGQPFRRREARHAPKPDDEGYYPDDYYLATDWRDVATRVLGGLAIVLVLTVAGFEFWDRYGADATDDTEEIAPTPTALPLVSVFACAGDPDPVSQMAPPAPILIGGRTADNRWLAFRNLVPPPTQLWVRAADVPSFDPAQVGIVSCADGPDELPTPTGSGREGIDTADSGAG